MIFNFPVLHDRCDTCRSRFTCMTMRIHKEFDDSKSFSEYLPFTFGLACFTVEPYSKVYAMKLYPGIGNGMQVDINY